MKTQTQTLTKEAKENDRMIAISTIENTVADIIRRNRYSAQRASEKMIHFAKGHMDFCIPPTQSEIAVQKKIEEMVDTLLEITGLTSREINALILVVNFA